MILQFQPQFVQPILDGTKIHTFRLDTNDRWKEGMKIHFATGVRTKQYRCFKEGICTGVQECTVFVYNKGILIDYLPQSTTLFAHNDGFNDADELFRFLREVHGKSILTGKIIHWTEFRY